ncbi:hypothetical protein GS506_09525 [Rhodococcus hoagii]|nr:hypothetical protein [Prescottella equi]
MPRRFAAYEVWSAIPPPRRRAAPPRPMGASYPPVGEARPAIHILAAN